ncbi:zinc finger protein 431 isoform X1 [Nilaparvata lugens]|uniref:zinc finger protein 431 isoform X1 n=1 Tax=Nilaparvata lugens TaxID=108931 RepID=UPI00193EB10C|nr:zinc finger protein 431 isoform X1 [Nilaparvata lugens]
MIEVNTVNLKNCGGVGNSNDESHVVNEYISNNIKNEIDIDETPIQELKQYDVDISIVKHEVEDDNFHENESLEEEKEKDDKEEGEEAKQDDDDNDNDFSDHIKDEIEIDEKPFQFPMEDIPCNIAFGSVKHIQNEDVNVGVANINCKAENVKNKIDINEGISIKEELEFIKKDFLNEDAVDPLLPKVEADNFHENESLQKEKEKDGKEEGEEAKKEEDDDDDDDDDDDFSDHIKDEIEIDEKPFQFPMKDIPRNIAVGSVKHNIQNEDVNVGVANINCKAENVKNKIDINEGIRVKEELAFVKKEFLNEDAVDPLLPKTEPVEPYGISNSQMDSDEFQRFGHVAVVSLCRLEDLASDVGRSLDVQSSNQDDEPSVEGGSSNSLGEGRLQLRCLRKYRINTSERGGDAETIQKSKHRNIKAYHCSRCKFTCLTKTRLEDHLQSHGKAKHVCSVCEYMTQDSSLFEIHSKIHECGKPPYECDVCDYKTIEKSKFIIHCRRHTEEKPFTCGICNSKFFRKSHLAVHIARHTGIRPYKCEKCDYKATTRHSLKLHIGRIHLRQIQKKNFCCSQCDSAFFYRSDLLDHERCIHKGDEEMIYSCTICKFKCNRMRNLHFHKRIHTVKKTLSCNECSFKCSKPSKLNEHKRMHSGEKPFKCNVCQYTAARKTYLKLHIRTHTKEKPYCCDQCDYRAASSCGLSIHKKTHCPTGEKRFKCDICGFNCNTLGNLKTHIRTHTGEKPFKCDICSFNCNALGNLKTHIRTHTGEKPFKCDICDYKSAQSSYLKTHVRVHHSGEKPFKCDNCDYQSSASSTLKIHVRTHHTGEKPFKCDFCNYRSAQSSNFKKHVRTHHTGEKPFKCDFCNYRSAQSSNLKTHVRTHHTGEEPFKCDNCDYQSSVSASLKNHVRTHHTGEKPFK